MSHILIKYETTPESAKDNAQLHAVWLIDNDPTTPHKKFESIDEPWSAEVDLNDEYVVYFHATIPGASSLKITAGERVMTFSMSANGIIKKMFYLHGIMGA